MVNRQAMILLHGIPVQLMSDIGKLTNHMEQESTHGLTETSMTEIGQMA